MSHLLQSTLFAIAAGLLAWVMKRKHPRLRYWIWVAASVKFLIPFSLLVSFGSRISWRTPNYEPVAMTDAFDAVPATPSANLTTGNASNSNRTPAASLVPSLIAVLSFLWICGSVTVLLRWCIRWRRVQIVLRQATPITAAYELETLRRLENTLGIRNPLTIFQASTVMEPCVFGILRPALIWPASLSQRLNAEQVRAILLHEVAHVRYRDNLVSAIHMIVEALFWFHPLVWWIGLRLVDERENACDQDVLQSGVQSRAYAESILKVCEFCLETPLVCAAGIGGSNLRKRIEAIVTNRIAEKPGFRTVLILVLATTLALMSPILFGLAHPAPQVREAFEVASIKPKKFQPGMLGISFLPGGLVRGEQAPLPMIISDAFDISMKQLDLEKVPRAVMEDVYDFEAKAGANALPDTAPAKDRNQQLRRMLQTLLADRFKLVLHKEQRENPVYALTVAPNGPKFEVSQTERKCPQESREDPFVVRFGDSCGRFGGGPASGIRGSNITTTRLIEYLEDFGDRRIIDRTGITGHFDAVLPPWNRSLQTPTAAEIEHEYAVEDPNGPTIFTVIQRALGLRLESVRAPVEMYVVDHIERPTPN